MSTRKKILGVDTTKLLRDSRLSENILGQIPDFKIEEAVDACIQLLSQQVKTYILADRSHDPIERNEAINHAHDALKELRVELLEKVQEKLFGFTRR